MNRGNFNQLGSRGREPPRNMGDFNPTRPPNPRGFRGDPILDDIMRRERMPGDPYLHGGGPLLRGMDPLSVQAQVIVIDPERRCRDYAEMILLKLKKIGLICDIIILDKFMSPSQVIDDATARGLLYTASVNLQNEMHQSITINILQGQPQEHRNMPFEDALKLVARNFDAHLLKLADSKSAPAPVLGRHSPETLEEIDPALSLLLINLAEGKSLRLPDLDKVLKYLNKQREKLAPKSEPFDSYNQMGSKIESLSKAPKPVQPPINAIPSLANKGPSQATLQAEDLQAKITKLFGDTNKQQSTVGSKPVSSGNAPLFPASKNTYTSGKVEKKTPAVGIDFSNPSVQNALQSLMQTGSNILGTVRNPASDVATTQSHQPDGFSSASSSSFGVGGRYDSQRPKDHYETSNTYDQTSKNHLRPAEQDEYESPRPVKRAKPGRHAIAGFY